jgi:hypothetical protein
MSSIIRLSQREISPTSSIPLKLFSFFVYVMVVAVVLIGFIGDEPKWGVFLLIGVIAITLIVYGVGFYSDSKSQAPLIPFGIFASSAPSLDITLGSFVFVYILMGMFQSRNFNLPLIIIYSIFIITATILKILLKDSSFGHVIVSLLIGILMGGIYGLIISITDKSNMIFADTAIGTEKCGYTRKRNFKCSVYKNGVLLKNL